MKKKTQQTKETKKHIYRHTQHTHTNMYMCARTHTKRIHKNTKSKIIVYKQKTSKVKKQQQQQKLKPSTLKKKKQTKISKNTFKFILCYPSTAGNGACLQVPFVHPVRLSWRTTISFVSSCHGNSFLVGMGADVYFPTSWLGVYLAWASAWCYSLCKFLCHKELFVNKSINKGRELTYCLINFILLKTHTQLLSLS